MPKKVTKGLHGLYVSLPKRLKVDRRSRMGRAISQLRNRLIDDLGGNLSVQQGLLLDRVVFKTIRLCSFEAAILRGPEIETERQSREYLALSNSLRLDLLALGLEKREAEVEDLKSYIAKTYGQEGQDEKAS